MTDRIVTAGRPEPLGVRADESGVNVAVYAARASRVLLCLFDEAGAVEIERIALPARTGDVFHGHVSAVLPGARYGFRVEGEWKPETGDRYNPAKLVIDPQATRIDRSFALHPAMFDVPPGTPFGAEPDRTDSAPFMPKAIVEEPDFFAVGLTPPRPHNRGRTVLYELHVRGFTALNPAIPEAIRGTYAALAHPASIAHLKRLGINAVELMPSSAAIDERHLPPLGLRNHWGYNPVLYAAPEPRLAPGGFPEIRAAVEALQAAGISVILDVVYNHTGEGDRLGATVSMRGFDNAGYYRLVPGDLSHFVDDTGCGNTLPLDRPQVLRVVLDAMRLWVVQTGIDGFRFDLGVTLARRDDGFDPAAPFLAAIAQDPVLRDRVLVTEPWDPGPGGYHLGAFPAGWGEWNDRYRDSVRRFWRGDGGMIGEIVTRFAGSADVFASRRRLVSDSINFVTAHDGFTLADLVAYGGKHNEANGEFNRDGTDANYSWNNGVEGPTDDLAILARRAAEARALMATLLFSRGTPMLSLGDELGRTQGGNNNAYAQDNAISYIDWESADEGMIEFAASLVAARKANAALRAERPLTGAAATGAALPDVQWLRADGAPFGPDDWNNGDIRTLIAALYEPAREGEPDNRVVVVLHAGDYDLGVTLPKPRAGSRWRIEIDSHDLGRAGPVAGGALPVAGRSAILVVEEPIAKRAGATDSEVLDRLATAAGLAPDWWDVDGNNHRVGDDTKRALLKAMRLPAGSTGEARDSLFRLMSERALAPLPLATVAKAGAAITLRLGPDTGAAGRPVDLVVEHEGRGTETIRIAPDAVRTAWTALPDRRSVRLREIDLPPQPPGRHVVRLADRADLSGQLVVAPGACHLPPALADGGRRFGLAAHLYSVPRVGDQGIGDFTTLGALGRFAAGAGAAVLGLNPLHALFEHDRHRTSPYHPCDRRFLEPIYIDVMALPAALLSDETRATLAAEAGRLTALSATPHVDYVGAWEAKRRVLDAAFQAFEARRASDAGDPALADFEAFVAKGGRALRRFTTFQAIAEARGTSEWWTWPADLVHPEQSGVEFFARAHPGRVRFFSFLQWIADLQLGEAAAAAREAGLSIGFYRDLAVGTAPDGAEAWSESDVLMSGVSVGAPPDPFAADGQIWNLPPPDPIAWAREGYAGFANLVSANMRHAGALRIDHVLGLRRLFLVPEGAGAGEGTYVAFPFQDLIGVLSLESTRAGCLVVGEDLGTVPEGTGEALMAADILSYRVLWFERDGETFRPPSAYPPRAASCVSTHDLPTLAGWWIGADIDERHRLAILGDAEAVAARAERHAAKEHLLAALDIAGVLGAPPALDAPLDPASAGAIHAFLAATPSMIALVQADDLTGETEALNLPGTTTERSNWSRKLRVPVSDLGAAPASGPILAAMAPRLGT